VAEAEELLIGWRHPLHLPDDEHPTGRPYTRPFGSLAFVMEDRGRRALADSARSHRDLLLEKAPERDLVLHNEHEQTLRALADVSIAGPDALQFPHG
jgi:hypothetical protein